MAIEDQVATVRPPLYHVHKYDAEADSVEDLNAWAVSLWSPLYSDRNPAFMCDATGVLHANVGGTFTTAVPDEFWIVFGINGTISILADVSFQTAYELAE